MMMMMMMTTTTTTMMMMIRTATTIELRESDTTSKTRYRSNTRLYS